VPLWARHGIKPVGFWEPVVGLSNELHYLLAWNDLAEREVQWSAFQADPEWISKRDESEASGPLQAKIYNELGDPRPLTHNSSESSAAMRSWPARFQ